MNYKYYNPRKAALDTARELLTGKYGVGRVIARPFVGDCAANFTRTPRRHDYSLVPPHDTMLDLSLIHI